MHPENGHDTLIQDALLNVPIGDWENTLSFPSEETSLGSGLPSHLSREMYLARTALLTVFSTTDWDIRISFITDLETLLM